LRAPYAKNGNCGFCGGVMPRLTPGCRSAIFELALANL